MLWSVQIPLKAMGQLFRQSPIKNKGLFTSGFINKLFINFRLLIHKTFASVFKMPTSRNMVSVP